MSPIDFDEAFKQKPALGRLSGKVALVTGVARPRGIGNVVAALYAREGATVCVTDIAAEVEECAKRITDAGGTAKAYRTDLTQLARVEAMAAEILTTFGRIDILCNCAGKSVPPRPPFLELTEEYWDLVMDRNVRTMFNCCKAVVPHMVARNYGKIVNLGSTTGPVTVYRYCTAYAASKGAVSAFGKALALELGDNNITVNTILPADVDTGDVAWKPGDTPRDLSLYEKRLAPAISRPVRPEEIADLALFLASDESRVITGTEILIDGGFTLVEAMPTGPQ